MANNAEIRDSRKEHLASLLMTKMLGGDLNDAITQAEAVMEPEDIEIVVAKIEARRKARESL